MRACLDACVLYPTVLREILMGVAKAGLIVPLWSTRLLEEWARAAARLNPADEVIARGEIALLRANWPKAEIAADASLEAQLWLPDPNDIHVLATAIAGQAEVIVTLNLKDFPLNEVALHGVDVVHPDALLLALWQDHPKAVAETVARVHAKAEMLSGETLLLRALLKRAKLPRLGKALTR